MGLFSQNLRNGLLYLKGLDLKNIKTLIHIFLGVCLLSNLAAAKKTDAKKTQMRFNPFWFCPHKVRTNIYASHLKEPLKKAEPETTTSTPASSTEGKVSLFIPPSTEIK